MKPVRGGVFTQTVQGSGDVHDLPVMTLAYESLGPAIVSCWRLSWRDLLRAIFRRKVYAVILGRSQPPILLSTDPKEVGIPTDES